MSYHDVPTRQISRRHFLTTSALSIAGLAVPDCLADPLQKMTPVPKRAPSAAESQAAIAFHTKGGKVLFQDDFRSQSKFEKNWTIFTDDLSKLKARRSAKSLSVSSHGLAIETVAGDHCRAKWSEGEVISRQSFLYGFYEAYMSAAHATGIDNAFWLTSAGDLNDGSGDSFEIDIAEIYYPRLIRSTLHRHNPAKGGDLYETGYNNPVHGNLGATFHDYGLLWTPSALVFCLDGVAYQTIETKNTINVPANLRLSAALGTFGGEPPDDPIGLTMKVTPGAPFMRSMSWTMRSIRSYSPRRRKIRPCDLPRTQPTAAPGN